MADWNSWVITTDERVKHDAQFQFLKPVNGYITGEQVKLFFLKSGLPPMVLGQIWNLADMDADGKLDKKEFSIAMFLIKKQLEGMQLPPTLPPGVKSDPKPVFVTTSSPSLTTSKQLSSYSALSSAVDGIKLGTSNLNGNASKTSSVLDGHPAGGTQPKEGDSQNWSIGPNTRPKYRLLFNQHDRAKRGFITGVEARGIFLHSGLSQQILAHIWSLADLDKDGNLNCEEFCIAAFLIDKALAGSQLPASLPPGLDPSHRTTISQIGTGAQTAQTENEEDAKPQALSFEDKRRENFLQGQLELDRRKQELAEQLRREEEARLEKERLEQERLEKIRLEKEREKALESERQAERIREIEAQREVRRRQAAEARTKAWRAAETERQLEAERQRVEALQKEKSQASTLLEQAIAHRASLLEAAASQDQRKRELETRLLIASAEVETHKSAINDMRDKRDTYDRDIRELTEQVEAAKAELSRWQREREELNLRISTGVVTNPAAEQCKTLRANSEARLASIRRLEGQLLEFDENMTRQGEQLATRRNGVADLEKRSNQLEAEIAKLRQQLETQFRAYVTLKNPTNAAQILSGLSSTRTADHSEQYEVMFDFKARHPDELSLTTGSLVKIIPDPPLSVAPGWMYGESNGMKGLFPESYVRKKVTGKIDPFDPFGIHKVTSNTTQKSAPTPIAPAPALPKHTAEDVKKSQSGSPPSSTPLFSCIALFPFVSDVAGDLNLAVNDVIQVYAIRDEWWEGTCERTKLSGLFPANYTKKLTPEESIATNIPLSSGSPPNANGPSAWPESEPVDVASTALVSSQSDSELTVGIPKTSSPESRSGQPSPSSHITISSKPEFARVIAPYTATSTGQLSLQPGQVVQIRKRSAKGWWEGELQQRGRVRQFGWFPADYVKVISANSFNGSHNKQLSNKNEAHSPPTTMNASNTTPAISVAANSSNAPKTSETVSPASPAPQSSTAPTVPTSHPIEVMQAIFSYKAAHADELTFEEGAIITVLGRDEPEWWRGRLQTSGAEGLFPVNYVRPYNKHTSGILPKQTGSVGSTTAATPQVVSNKKA